MQHHAQRYRYQLMCLLISCFNGIELFNCTKSSHTFSLINFAFSWTNVGRQHNKLSDQKMWWLNFSGNVLMYDDKQKLSAFATLDFPSNRKTHSNCILDSCVQTFDRSNTQCETTMARFTPINKFLGNEIRRSPSLYVLRAIMPRPVSVKFDTRRPFDENPSQPINFNRVFIPAPHSERLLSNTPNCLLFLVL